MATFADAGIGPSDDAAAPGAEGNAGLGVASRIDQAHGGPTARQTSSAGSVSPVQTDLGVLQGDASCAKAGPPTEFAPGVPPLHAASPALLASLAQFRLQAGQLAKILRDRQRDLDRRESQLNAQRAQFDQEVRSMRQWWDERAAELARQDQEVRERELALADRDRAMHSRERELAALVARCEVRAREVNEARLQVGRHGN